MLERNYLNILTLLFYKFCFIIKKTKYTFLKLSFNTVFKLFLQLFFKHLRLNFYITISIY